MVLRCCPAGQPSVPPQWAIDMTVFYCKVSLPTEMNNFQW
jgi:hypothetical protein